VGGPARRFGSAAGEQRRNEILPQQIDADERQHRPARNDKGKMDGSRGRMQPSQIRNDHCDRYDEKQRLSYRAPLSPRGAQPSPTLGPRHLAPSPGRAQLVYCLLDHLCGDGIQLSERYQLIWRQRHVAPEVVGGHSRISPAAILYASTTALIIFPSSKPNFETTSGMIRIDCTKLGR
jgi:hypothetical protein